MLSARLDPNLACRQSFEIHCRGAPASPRHKQGIHSIHKFLGNRYILLLIPLNRNAQVISPMESFTPNQKTPLITQAPVCLHPSRVTYAILTSQQPQTSQPQPVASMSIPPGGNRNVRDLPYDEEGKREWSHDLFDCLGDVDTCALGILDSNPCYPHLCPQFGLNFLNRFIGIVLSMPRTRKKSPAS